MAQEVEHRPSYPKNPGSNPAEESTKKITKLTKTWEENTSSLNGF